MATTTLSLKYRPLRVGFLVREGSIEDLVKAAGINTLLWGGIYNPVIPVSTTSKNISNQLLKLFSVDVLFAVSRTNEIDEIVNNNPFLRDPDHYAENIFYEDWNTKKNIVGYLDAINIVDHYWWKELKTKPKSYKSNCTLVMWNDTDTCSNLFSLLYGYFPQIYNLRDNFEKAFLNGLKSKKLTLKNNGTIDDALTHSLSPIRTTGLELRKEGGTWRGDGIYIGSESDFTDLMYFWNLRASGLSVEFLSQDSTPRFTKSIKAYIKRLNDTPNSNQHIEDSIYIYYRGDHQEAQNIMGAYKTKKRFAFSRCDEVSWNGLNIKPTSIFFTWKQVSANIDKKYDKYNVSIPLPEKRFLNSEEGVRDIGHQYMAVSIDSFAETAHAGYTLNPPFIRELNEFYSREIAMNPWELRSEKDGIGLLIKACEDSVSLYPIIHQKIIEQIFHLAGFKAQTSQAGLLTKQIILNMREDNPIEACRVFKVTGVRELLASPKTANEKAVKWSEGTKVIWDNNFQKFETLHIESRDKKKLGSNDVFSYLVKKRVLAPRLSWQHKLLGTKVTFKCRNCGLKENIYLKDYQNDWRCPSCNGVNRMREYFGEDFQGTANKYWRFKRAGLFAKDNHQEGAVPVILTLLSFVRIFDLHKLIYSTSLELKNSEKCEIDLCVLQYDRGNEIQVGIAECKSKGQKINQQDILNLTRIQDKLNALGLDCFIIFAKTADKYESEELALFKTLSSENRKIIILSNKELEPYHPYWEMEETEKLPEKYALDMMGMHRNSLFLYLRDRN